MGVKDNLLGLPTMSNGTKCLVFEGPSLPPSLDHIHLGQPGKSSVLEHRLETGYNIDFSHISVLDKATEYMDHVIKEVIEIILHSRNSNRNGGFTLNQSWYLVRNLLKQYIGLQI
jgi:hypothetical protein